MKKLLLMFFAILFLACAERKSEVDFGMEYNKMWGAGDKPQWVLNHGIFEQTAVNWSTGKHTATPVPLGAVGPKKYLKMLSGIIQNTDIAKTLKLAVSENVNVILVIGDGMGFGHLSLPIFNNIARENGEQTYFEKITKDGTTGIVFTNPYKEIITSSAAAATAIASGTKTRVGMLGLGPNGKRVETILDVAEKNNLSTGLISEAPITHATPAGFYGHSISRSNQNLIAEQLVNDNEIEVLLGGGAKFFIPANTLTNDFDQLKKINVSLQGKSARKDKKNLLKIMQNKGYEIVSTKDELSQISNKTKKLLGLFAANAMNARIDRDNENTGEPSLVEMSEKAITILQKNKKGYFLMIEAARIDWEAHANDAGAVLKAVEEMNDVLEYCYKVYKTNPKNTLLVFTADHETGGLGLSYYSLPKGKRIPIKLESGDIYTPTKFNLPFSDYLKLNKQNSTFEKIFTEKNDFNNFYKKISDNVGYKIDKTLARKIYEEISKFEGYK